MEKINFIKMNGAGNDFILVNQIENPNFVPNSYLIKQICNRRKGIGADGLLFIKNNENYDFELEYYNSNGSLGSLCGNGARCSIKFAIDNFEIGKNKTTFLCNNKIYSGEKIDSEIFKFNLNEISQIKINQQILFEGKNLKFHFVDNGSPHVIIFWEDFENYTKDNFDEFDVFNFGRKIRYSEVFKPFGTNVNFIKIEKKIIKIRTFERGVEEETLACGTGTVASAIILNLINKINSPITFLTKDNDELIVEFEKNEKFEKITLTGPAKINYIGTYNFQK
ncbi:MAG: diaminopimelate epimerase [Ignavibacteriae bacterium]|nr:diaminopimelate epimerase [Ignavibacteriota bacterium]